VRSAIGVLRRLDWSAVDRIYDELAAEARGALMAAGCKADEIRFQFGADLRYAGQQHEIAVALAQDPREHHDVALIAGAFETAYLAHYGVAPSHVDVELVSWRLVAQGPAEPVVTIPPASGAPAGPKTTRTVHLWPDAPVPVYDRGAVVIGQTVNGPVLIEERETTIVILPGWQATTDHLGCIIATRT
jgi:N-methylhydantoinase A